MSIAILCPGCGKRFEVPYGTAGKIARCKACGQCFLIPVVETPNDTEGPVEQHVRSFLDDLTGGADSARASSRAVSSEPIPVQVEARRAPASSEFARRAPVGAAVRPASPPWLQPVLLYAAGIGLFSIVVAAVAVILPAFVPRGSGGEFGDMDIVSATGASEEAAEYPALPDPGPEVYPAGRPAREESEAPIREDVVARHERALEDLLGYLDRLAEAFESVRDLASLHAARGRVEEQQRLAARKQGEVRDLPKMTVGEERALAGRVAERGQATIARMRASSDRMVRLPDVGFAAASMRDRSQALASEIELRLTLPLASVGTLEPQPYVDVFVEGVSNGEVARFLGEQLAELRDVQQSASVLARWEGGRKGASYRLDPVANPEAFAKRITFGKARVAGHCVFVSELRIELAALAAYRERQESRGRAAARERRSTEERAKPTPAARHGGPASAFPGAQAQPPAPAGAPADADEMTQVLGMLDSGDFSQVRAGLAKLVEVRPEEATRARVVAALKPIALGADRRISREAVRALCLWGGDEAFDVLIQVVERSNDVFTRHDAIKGLAGAKVVRAARAIAARLLDHRVEAGQALRALGPAAESEVVPLLTDENILTRREACDILRDIGGAAALRKMMSLPPETDPLVARNAARAMEAIAERLGSAETKRIQAGVKKKR